MEQILSSEKAIRRRGTKALLASAVVSQCLTLVRFLLLARLLGPEQLGLAATLVLTQSFFDLVTDMSPDRFLVQDKDGDDVSVQDFLQLTAVGRGVAIALAMAACAWPLAYFYKTPALAPALVALALFPFIRSFVHLDYRRAQRNNDFWAEAVTTLVSELAGLVVTVLAAYLTRSYVSVIYGLIARALALVVSTHMMSERKYGLKYCKEHAPRFARFSAPLMLNGVILFFAGQGDRVFVARNVGTVGLGLYSAVLLLVLYPTSTLQRFVHTMYLPLVAAKRNEPVERAAVSDELGGQTILLALCMAAGFALVAPMAIPILYGHRFAQSVTTVTLIGIMQTTRYASIWPTTVAMAMGRSNVVLANNVLSLSSWPAALLGVWLGYGLLGIVVGFTVGEFAANTAALMLLNRSEKLAILHGFDRLFVFLAGSVIIYCWAILAGHFSIIGLSVLLVCSAALVAWIAHSENIIIRKTISRAKAFFPLPL